MKPLSALLVILALLSAASILSDCQVVKAVVSRYIASTSTDVIDTNTTSATDSTPPDSNDTRPSGLRLVLIGDSITRYQYLSLAYFLRHGHWFDPEQKPHLVNQNTFMRRASKGQGWIRFFNKTNQLLAPMEQCDCFRARWPNIKAVDGNVMENRYFHDPHRNNSLAYIQAFGNSHSVMHGRVLPKDAFRDIHEKEFIHVNTSWQWSFSDWGEALEKYVAPMNATHVMMNAGLWPNNFDRNRAARDGILQALERTGLVGIWRTNSYLTSRELRPSSASADEAMVGLFGDNVLNVSWTRGLETKYYWDDKHFLEPVYRVMNEQLLEMIGYDFPPEYEKQSLADLQDSNVTLQLLDSE